jgi:hypothetical protein
LAAADPVSFPVSEEVSLAVSLHYWGPAAPYRHGLVVFKATKVLHHYDFATFCGIPVVE